MQVDFDVLIIGGGMVGASLACALHGQSIRIGIVEAVPLTSKSQPSFDDRIVALAYGSKRIFDGIDLWQPLQDKVTPIRRIHVSNQGHFGGTRLDCEKEGVAALGYVLENRELGQILATRVMGSPDIDLICPGQLVPLNIGKDWVSATIESGTEQKEIKARLVIGADGSNSRVRDLAGIVARRWDYGQSAIITNVITDRHHSYTAYERFTNSGPLAFLPMRDSRCSVVWTVRNEHLETTLSLGNDEFISRLQHNFGYRLGQLKKAGRRNAFPLRLVRAAESVRPRVVIIGNAAHTLHPVAGQGYNLGLRDVAVMAEVITDAVRCGQDPGADPVLNQYAEWRRRDQRNITALTDCLVRLFSNPLAPVALLRNAGLLAIDFIPSLKHLLAKQTMGLAGRQPRVVRGIPL